MESSQATHYGSWGRSQLTESRMFQDPIVKGISSDNSIQNLVSVQGTNHDSNEDSECVIGTQIPIVKPPSGTRHGNQYLGDGASSSNENNFRNINQVMPPWSYDRNTSFSEHQDPFAISLSQEMNLSYTELLLSAGGPTSSQGYMQNNHYFMVEPMGSENKTFMITGRYASSQSTLLDEEGEEEEQPLFGGKDEVEGEEEEAEIPNEDEPQGSADKFYNWQWEGDDQGNDDPIGKENMSSEQINVSHEEADNCPAADMEMPDGVEKLTPEDIRLYLESESVKVVRSGSQEVLGHHVPHLNMIFDTKDEAYKFYNVYASICGFSMKKTANYKGKSGGENIVTRLTMTCNKWVKVVDANVLEERKNKRRQRKQERSGSAPSDIIKQRRRNVNEVTDDTMQVC